MKSNQEAVNYCTEAEHSVLTCMLFDNSVIDDMIEKLDTQEFYFPAHQIIFEKIKEIHQQQQPVDFLILLNFLKYDEKFNKSIGEGKGEIYLYQLANNIGLSSNIETYVTLIKHYATQREIIKIQKSIQHSLSSFHSIQEQFQKLQMISSLIEALNDNNSGIQKDCVSCIELDGELMDFLEYSTKHANEFETGLMELDNLVTKIEKGNLLIIAARPGMGKTTFCLNLCYHWAKSNKRALLASLEMSANHIGMRLVTLASSRAFNLKKLSEEDKYEISKILAETYEARKNIQFIHEPRMSVTKLKSLLTRQKKKNTPIDFVIIDHLQIMTPEKEEDRHLQLSGISRNLKILAEEFQIPIIALSQINRGVESRADKRPLISDLKESGAIEQDADIVMLLYREEYYDKDCLDKNKAEIIVAKNRNGRTGTAHVQFNAELGKFMNLPKDTESISVFHELPHKKSLPHWIKSKRERDDS